MLACDELDYVSGLVGKRYRLGAQGPDEFDCWSLCRAVQKRLFNRQLEAVEIASDESAAVIQWFMTTHKEMHKWARVDRPVHGCLVAMTLGIERSHLATFLNLDHGLLLHALPGRGVCLETETDLQFVGWDRFRYWVPK